MQSKNLLKETCQCCKFYFPKGRKPDGHCNHHKIDIPHSNFCNVFIERPKSKQKSFTQKAMEKIKK